MAGYRPRDAIVDLAIESALDMFRRLHERLSVQAGDTAISDLVLGIDVVHLEKQGQNIRLLGSTRLDPEVEMIDRYAQFRDSFWNPIFRRQRLLNLVNNREWHAGFNSILQRYPFEQTIGNNFFRRDARESFSNEVETMSEEPNTRVDNSEASASASSAETTEGSLIYRLVGVYLSRKLKSKYQLEWVLVKDHPDERDEYEKTKGKLARETFLAIRSRTGQDFVDYFASTLCSVPQNMNEQSFTVLTKALLEDTDKVRTLTMLALSARG